MHKPFHALLRSTSHSTIPSFINTDGLISLEKEAMSADETRRPCPVKKCNMVGLNDTIKALFQSSSNEVPSHAYLTLKWNNMSV